MDAESTSGDHLVEVNPGDPLYRDLRLRGYNRRLVGTPDSVFVVDNTDQVVNAVAAAAASGRKLAVRSGGHCVEGPFIGTCSPPPAACRYPPIGPAAASSTGLTRTLRKRNGTSQASHGPSCTTAETTRDSRKRRADGIPIRSSTISCRSSRRCPRVCSRRWGSAAGQKRAGRQRLHSR
jgi:hypothetical protein